MFFRKAQSILRTRINLSSSGSFHFHHFRKFTSNGKKPREKNLYQQLYPFIKFATPEFRIIGYSLGLLLISSSVTMFVPFSMGTIIDLVMQNDKDDSPENDTVNPLKSNNFLRNVFKNLGSLSAVFGALGAVFVVGAAANAGRQVLMACASERVVTRLRTELFKKILRQDITFHDKNRSGELISRLSTDTVVVGKTLTSNIADGLRSLVMATTGLGAMLYVNVDLTMTMMLIVPGISTIAIFYGKFVRKLAKDTTDSSAELTKFANEKIGNIRTVRAFSQEPTEEKSYTNLAQKVYDLGVKEGIASALFFSSMGFSGNMVILAILYYGGSLVHQNLISIGELTSFFLYTTYVGTSLVGLSTWYSYLNKGAGSGERIFELLESKSIIEYQGGKKLIDVQGNIQFKSVEFAYPTRADAYVLKGVSFDLVAGETVAIVGHSGSGKSTIAQLILRYYDPSNGSITLDGTPINELDPFWLRESVIGYVSQEPTLFATSVLENIRYGTPSALDDEVVEAAKKANAHDFIAGFPNGYSTEVGDRGHAISGGQKQRIAIARALLKNPRILVLDEATSALDAASENLVQQALDRLIRGRTVVTIAHRLSTIQKADRIFMIANGKVIEHGTYDDLIQKGGHFSNLVGSLADQ